MKIKNHHHHGPNPEHSMPRGGRRVAAASSCAAEHAGSHCALREK
jgi:hypothetical protein